MSTKTTFKRVALVAVAALGLGVLSVAPSQATVSNLTTVVVNGTSAAEQSDSLTAATVTVTGFVNNSRDTITVQFIEDGARPTAVSGFTAGTPRINIIDTASVASLAKPYNADGASTSPWDGFDLADSAAINTEAFEVFSATANRSIGAKFGVQLESRTALLYGTYNYLMVVTSYSHAAGGDTQTVSTTTVPFSIVVDRPSTASKTPVAARSFANLYSAGKTAGTAKSTDDDVIAAVSTASSTNVGFVFVGNRNSANGNDTAEDSLTATVTGAGVVCASTGLGANPTVGTCGKSIKVAATGDYQFVIRPDGSAGTSTVAVASGVLGVTYTKSLTFYAASAKTITATAFTPILTVGTNDSAVVITAVDANGTNWAGTAYIYASTAADALIGGSATAPVACVASTDKTKQYCPITTKAAGTAKFKVIDASTIARATATSNEVSVTASSATAATVKLAFDKATYGPGEKAILTITPVDSAGNKIAASTANYLAAALTTNVSVVSGGNTVSSLGSASVTTVAYDGTDSTAGSQSIVVYMPQGSGTVTVTGKGGTSLPLAGQVVVTASADVVNASVDAATDAANEATDAANAATDAALAAADAADAATAAAQDASDAVAALSASVSKMISSLRAQITSLTNLVIKIQKKVRA